jgi:hypothetical protein
MTNTIWQWVIPTLGTIRIKEISKDSFTENAQSNPQESEKETANFHRYFLSLVSL